MSDTIETTGPAPVPAAGLSRRDALKRGAVVGGALIWAVPTVQTIAMTAANAVPPSNVGELPSNIQFIVQYCGANPPRGVETFKPYSLKYETENGGSWDAAPKDANKGGPTENVCLFGLSRSVATPPVIAIFASQATVTPVTRTINGVRTSGISLQLPDTNWQYTKQTTVGGSKIEDAYVHDGQNAPPSKCSVAFADPQVAGAFYYPKPNSR